MIFIWYLTLYSLICFKFQFTFFTAKVTIQSEHLQAVFTKEKTKAVYAMPSTGTSPDSGEFTVFQIVSLNPDRRSYLQRAFALSKDESGLVYTLFIFVFFLNGYPMSLAYQK